MKKAQGMSAREKAITELAARVIKVALDDLPNNRELCSGIVMSAALHQNDVKRELTKAAWDEYNNLPWWKRLYRSAP